MAWHGLVLQAEHRGRYRNANASQPESTRRFVENNVPRNQVGTNVPPARCHDPQTDLPCQSWWGGRMPGRQAGRHPGRRTGTPGGRQLQVVAVRKVVPSRGAGKGLWEGLQAKPGQHPGPGHGAGVKNSGRTHSNNPAANVGRVVGCGQATCQQQRRVGNQQGGGGVVEWAEPGVGWHGSGGGIPAGMH